MVAIKRGGIPGSPSDGSGYAKEVSWTDRASSQLCAGCLRHPVLARFRPY